MIEAIIVLIFTVLFCAVGIGSHLLRIILRLDTVIDLLKSERTANARHRLGM